MNDTQLEGRQLQDFVTLEARYSRAADVNRDRARHELIPPFHSTGKSTDLLRSIVAESVTSGGGATAIIGPYGAGKSLFTVALMALLDREPPDSWTVDALNGIREIDRVLAEQIEHIRARGGYLCLAAEASPEGITRPLLAALKAEISRLGRRPALSRRVAAMLRNNRDADLLPLIEEVITAAGEAGYQGLLIVVDEFGRVLEGSPRESSNALAIVQELAELAERTAQPRFDLVVTVHQNFQDYTTSLSPGRRAEWAKVQGRFRQFPFVPNASDAYNGLAENVTIAPELSDRVASWAANAWSSVELALGREGDEALRSHVGRLWPLHPLAAFLLPRLAIAVGQNERSMYAFISSGDPRSLRGWLARQLLPRAGAPLPCIEVDRLFDYFAASEFGSGLPRRTRQVLAQARVALEQLDDAGGLQTRIIKAVAAISLARDHCAVRVTHPVLAAAFADVDESALDRALRTVVARRVLLRREHTGEYVLDPGTGIDVDDLVDRAIRDLAGSTSLRNEVEQVLGLEPVIAHRLTFERGTTRSFAREFVVADNLGSDESQSHAAGWQDTRTRPDGRIRYVLAVDEKQLAFAERVAARNCSPVDILVLPCEPLVGLPHVAIELAALRRIQSGSDGLDPVARHELYARVEEAKAAVLAVLAPLLEPGAAGWWTGEAPVLPQTHREIQALLSDSAAATFPWCPTLRNELINRRELSSSAVVAAKLVVRRLISHDFRAGLGFEGNGPEVSIVHALLERTGMLSQDPASGEFRIGPPQDPDWLRVWNAAERALTEGLEREVPLSELWDLLSGAPYGIRSGVLPLLTWALLAAHRETVCLFERGTYLHTWSEELYDRMVRWPSAFTLRRLPSDGTGATIVSELFAVVPGGSTEANAVGEAPLNRFLSTLFAWYRGLPEYSKRTRSVSEPTQRLRATLNRAKDPVALVLREIPAAMGFSQVGGPELRSLASAFSSSVAELDDAYPQLLQHTVRRQADLLGIADMVPQAREEYGRLRDALQGYSLRPKTASFLLRGADNSLADVSWCESVASTVTGSPPGSWSDADVAAFDSNIGPLLLEIQEGFDTRVRLGGGSNESLSTASRIALFRRGSPVVDVIARRSLSSDGVRILEAVRTMLTDELVSLPEADHAALAASILELLFPPPPEPEGPHD